MECWEEIHASRTGSVSDSSGIGRRGVLQALADADSAPPTPTPPAFDSGVLATFDVDGERFRVWVSIPQTVQQVLDLQQGRSSAHIPNGRILRGPGRNDHNAPWSWHLDPQDISMAEVTIELCDGRPSYVEDNLDEFVDTVQRYCPWGASLVDVQRFGH